MAKGKPGKKSKHKGQPGNHADVEKKIWKRSVKRNAAMVNAAPAYIPVPVPVPVPAPLSGPVPSHLPPYIPAVLPGPVPSHFPAHVPHVPAALPASHPSHVPLRDGSPSNNEAAGGERVAGFIFMCSVTTKPECYRYRVFGLPKGRMEAVDKIKTGAKLFLFDFDLKLLYGIYEALGNGGESLEPAAFGGSFPAQVRFSIAKDCLPVPEGVFKHVIRENYRGKKFAPELNSEQVKKLSLLFQEIPPQQTAILPALPRSQHLAAAQVPPLPGPYRGAAAPVLDSHNPMPSLVHPHELYTPPALHLDDRGLLQASHHPQRAATYAARVHPVVEPPRTYGTAVHPGRVHPITEARNTPPVTESSRPSDRWRTSEPFRPRDPQGDYLPQNPQEQELVSSYLGGREARASPPRVDYHNSAQARPPGSNSTSDYYSAPHLHADPFVGYSSQSPKHAYYSTPHAATVVVAEMRRPLVAHAGPGYHDANHVYAGARPTASVTSVPYASSFMYLPAPTYR